MIISHRFITRYTGKHAFTTRELALLCSYALRAVLTIGNPETRETNCGGVGWSSDVVDEGGELDDVDARGCAVGEESLSTQFQMNENLKREGRT